MNSKVFFDIMIAQKQSGRLIFELFAKDCPKTTDNFLQLCTGEKGNIKIGQREVPLSFKNSIFHRIIPGFMVQGGDFTNFNGTGGASIYGQKFNDENFIHKHTTKGLLSMANSGKNTNGSQFFITLAPCSWLDGNHVVFGKVVEGMDVLDQMERLGSQSGRVSSEVKISNCGKL